MVVVIVKDVNMVDGCYCVYYIVNQFGKYSVFVKILYCLVKEDGYIFIVKFFGKKYIYQLQIKYDLICYLNFILIIM